MKSGPTAELNYQKILDDIYQQLLAACVAEKYIPSIPPLKFSEGLKREYLNHAQKQRIVLYIASLMHAFPFSPFEKIYEAFRASLQKVGLSHQQWFCWGIIPYVVIEREDFKIAFEKDPDFANTFYKTWSEQLALQKNLPIANYYPDNTAAQADAAVIARFELGDPDSFFVTSTNMKFSRAKNKQPNHASYWQISNKILMATETLGTGKYATVKLVSDKLGNLFSLRIEKNPEEDDTAHYYRLMRHLGYYYGHFKRSDKYYSVNKYYSGLTLAQTSTRFRIFSPLKSIAMGLSLCVELYKLHLKGVAHGDLKSGNIIVNQLSNEKVKLKIIDYNFSIRVPITIPIIETWYILGHEYERPPEVITKQDNKEKRCYGYPSEIYSLSYCLEKLYIQTDPLLIGRMRDPNYETRIPLDKVIETLLRGIKNHFLDQLGLPQNKYLENIMAKARKVLTRAPSDESIDLDKITLDDSIKGYTPYSSYRRQLENCQAVPTQTATIKPSI